MSFSLSTVSLINYCCNINLDLFCLVASDSDYVAGSGVGSSVIILFYFFLEIMLLKPSRIFSLAINNNAKLFFKKESFSNVSVFFFLLFQLITFLHIYLLKTIDSE